MIGRAGVVVFLAALAGACGKKGPPLPPLVKLPVAPTEFVAERRRYEERIRALFREGRDASELRTDLDDAAAARVFLSVGNWAYTWLEPGRDTDGLADRFFALLVDGMRGYSTPA